MIEPHDEAGAADQGDGPGEVEQEHRIGEVLAAERLEGEVLEAQSVGDELDLHQPVVDPQDPGEADERSAGDVGHVAHADVAPRAAVDAHDAEDDALDEQHRRQQGQEERGEPHLGAMEVVGQAEGHQPAKGEEGQMSEGGDQEAVGAGPAGKSAA